MRATDVNLIFFLALLGLLTAALPLALRMYRLLKERHHETWSTLGEPRNLFRTSIQNQILLNRFVWRGQYRALNDDQLSAVCSWLKILGIAFGVAFGSWMALTALGQL